MWLNQLAHWYAILPQAYWQQALKVEQRLRKSTNHNVFPPEHEVFKAFALCSPQQLKVIVLGQDPYHGVGQANGLAFSVNHLVSLPPSLQNIYKELSLQFQQPAPKHGDLSGWAVQGVLLLNTVLTVQEARAGSHRHKGWENFTDSLIQAIAVKTEHKVFLLWGGDARKKAKWIKPFNHCILESGHPSPLSANRGHWFGNEHFIKANQYLQNHGQEPIDWLAL